MIAAVPFSFNEADHSYWLGEQRIPSVTQLIEMGGLVNGAMYFTDAHRQRGTAVHSLCADWDLGVLDLPRLESSHRGYVLGYVEACQKLKPEWQSIEVADVHPTLRFAGRIDRAGQVFGRRTICEIKSGVKAKHHSIQLALQAVLKAPSMGVPPEMIQRLTLYLKPTGRFSVECHEDRRDFEVAMSLIKRFCS